MRVLLICLLGLVLVALASARNAGSDTGQIRVAYDISMDGPAVFYGIRGTERQVLWKVDCTIRLRNCIARGHGLILSVNRQNQALLGAMKPPGARISIQMKNQRVDAPQLLNTPLRESDVERLSRHHSFVLIEDKDHIVSRFPTYGLRPVISYLTWIGGPQARSLRDARLWPDFQAVDHFFQEDDDYAQRSILLHRHQPFDPPQTLPVTKPQIEFAISAQGGTSFYSETGRAGY